MTASAFGGVTRYKPFHVTPGNFSFRKSTGRCAPVGVGFDYSRSPTDRRIHNHTSTQISRRRCDTCSASKFEACSADHVRKRHRTLFVRPQYSCWEGPSPVRVPANCVVEVKTMVATLDVLYHPPHPVSAQLQARGTRALSTLSDNSSGSAHPQPVSQPQP